MTISLTIRHIIQECREFQNIQDLLLIPDDLEEALNTENLALLSYNQNKYCENIL